MGQLMARPRIGAFKWHVPGDSEPPRNAVRTISDAIRALRPAPTGVELESVVQALERDGDPAEHHLLDAAVQDVQQVAVSVNGEAFEEVAAIATEAGAGPFIALDLVTAWSLNKKGRAAEARPTVAGQTEWLWQ